MRFTNPDEDLLKGLRAVFVPQISKKPYKVHQNEIICEVLQQYPGTTLAVFHRSLEFKLKNKKIAKTWDRIQSFNFIKIAKQVFSPNFKQLEGLDETWVQDTIDDLKSLNHSACVGYYKTAMVEENLASLHNTQFAEF